MKNKVKFYYLATLMGSGLVALDVDARMTATSGFQTAIDSLVDQDFHQSEVHAAGHETRVAIGWMDRDEAQSFHFSSHFAAIDPLGRTIRKDPSPLVFENEIPPTKQDQYRAYAIPITGNPVVTVDHQGNFYGVHMNTLGFIRGQLEVTRFDAKREEWSDFQSINSFGLSSSSDSLAVPDKPWIVSDGQGNLAVLYCLLEMSDNLELQESGIYLQFSRDRGITWSKPRLIFDRSKLVTLQPTIEVFGVEVKNADEPRSFGPQGVSAAFDGKGRLHVSMAGYFYQPVFYAVLESLDANVNVKKVSGQLNARIGVTQLQVSQDGERIAIVANSPHHYEETRLVFSDDGGSSWKERTLSQRSALPSLCLGVSGQPKVFLKEEVEAPWSYLGKLFSPLEETSIGLSNAGIEDESIVPTYVGGYSGSWLQPSGKCAWLVPVMQADGKDRLRLFEDFPR